MGQEAGLAPRRLGVARAVGAGDEHPAAGGTHERRRDAKERRLARAVGAEERHGFAAPDVEIDPVEDEVPPVRFAEPADGDEEVEVASHEWNRSILPHEVGRVKEAARQPRPRPLVEG